MNIDMELVKEYLRIRGELDQLRQRTNTLNADAGAVELRLCEQFAMAGVQNMNCDGHTLYLNVEKYANARKEHRAALVDWARRNELDEMIVLQPASFKSWCREQIEGEGLPAEIAPLVEVFEKTSLRVRAS